MRRIFPCILAAALAFAALGQEFEAVSVKPNNSGSGSSHSSSDQGMLRATNLSLRNLIVTAYGMKDYQVEGPDWLSSERFDVTAKFPEALPKDREKYNAAFTVMMQKMLADRFKLVAHREQKTFSVYGLVVGKTGIKFKEVPNNGDSRSDSHNTHYEGRTVSMAKLAEFLSRNTDLPVLDMTGLKGSYDLTLDWSPEPRQSGDGKDDAPVIADRPALPEALQEQLGLKLESRKAPIEILVVDHAEKVPTEN
jgi:uncharacterized protein (TIGR03435 family)